MLDFDAGKLLIIGLVALVVIGPKDLPRVLRQVGQAVSKLRRMAGEFQGQFMDAMKEADLQDIKAELAKIKDNATLDVDFDPVRDVKDHVTGALDTSSAAPASTTPLMTGTTDGGLSGFELPAAPQLDHAHAEAVATVEAAGIVPGPGAGLLPEPEAAPVVAEATPVVAEATPVVAEAMPFVAEATPVLAEATPAPDVAEAAPAHEHTSNAVDPSLDQDTGLPGARRRIVVTRRRRLSRLDGPTLRAAVLAGHSRNIRPARRGTVEP